MEDLKDPYYHPFAHTRYLLHDSCQLDTLLRSYHTTRPPVPRNPIVPNALLRTTASLLDGEVANFLVFIVTEPLRVPVIGISSRCRKEYEYSRIIQ